MWKMLLTDTSATMVSTGTKFYSDSFEGWYSDDELEVFEKSLIDIATKEVDRLIFV